MPIAMQIIPQASQVSLKTGGGPRTPEMRTSCLPTATKDVGGQLLPSQIRNFVTPVVRHR